MQRGSVVLVSLCFTIVIGIAVAGYLSVCSRAMSLSNRSLAATSSVQLAEVGLEEAFWSINQFAAGDPSAWNGWTISGSTATRQLPPFINSQGASGIVTITVQNYAGTAPTIIAKGVSQIAGGPGVSKQLQVTTKPAALFNNAVAAIDPTNNGYVYFGTLSGGTVNSYESSVSVDPANSAQTKKDQAIVSGPLVYANYAKISGYLSTLNTTSYTFSNSGGSYVGTLKGATSPSNPPVDTSRVSTSPNQPLFDIKGMNSFSGTKSSLPAPTSGPGGGQGQGQGQGQGKGKGPGSGQGGGQGGGGSGSASWTIGTPGASTASIYYTTDLIITGAPALTVDGPVILYVTHDFSISSTGSIVITPNGSLQIVVENNISIAGGGIDNQTLLPKNLAVFGKKVSTITPYQVINTTTPFYGVFYSPYAVLEAGSSTVNPTVRGSLVAQKVLFSGTPTFHYDLDLRNATFAVVDLPPEITKWQESTSTGS